MKVLGRLLGYVSVLANLALALLALAMGLVGSISASEMYLDVIPVDPAELPKTLIFGGIIGLVAVALALRPGRLSRTLLLLWCLLAPGLLLWAFFRPDYRFDDMEHFQLSAWVFLGSLVALFGGFLHWKLAPGRRRL